MSPGFDVLADEEMSPGFDVPIIRWSGGGGVSSGRNKPIDGGVGWAGSAVDVAVFGFGAAAMLEVSLSQLCCPHLDDWWAKQCFPSRQCWLWGVGSCENKLVDGGDGWTGGAVDAAAFGAAAMVDMGISVGWIRVAKWAQLTLKMHCSQTAKAPSNSTFRQEINLLPFSK
jgi:hypothetical protein